MIFASCSPSCVRIDALEPGAGLLAVEWDAPPGVRAVMSTRAGGTSVAPWKSLNLGDHVGDRPERVAGNRQRLCLAAQVPAAPRWMRQVHGNSVALLDAPDAAAVPEADAAVTTRAANVCVVLTADCLPVLLAARDGSAVAAAHAGWRGLAAGVLEATVDRLRMLATPGTALQAWLGPAIGPRRFEVGDDVREAFVARDRDSQASFVPTPDGRWLCNLYALARLRLAAAGVREITGGGHCTYDEEALFFSHRRDVQHRGLAGTGRMAALIWRQN